MHSNTQSLTDIVSRMRLMAESQIKHAKMSCEAEERRDECYLQCRREQLQFQKDEAERYSLHGLHVVGIYAWTLTYNKQHVRKDTYATATQNSSLHQMNSPTGFNSSFQLPTCVVNSPRYYSGRAYTTTNASSTRYEGNDENY